MTMKKLLALLLVLVMVVALVACGGNGNETEAPTNNSQPASDATEEAVLLQTYDLDALLESRSSWGLFRDRRPEYYGAITHRAQDTLRF